MKKTAEVPFILRYQKPIPEEDVVEINGRYDVKTQTLSSFPNREGPATRCTIATRVTPTIVKTDTAADD